MALVLNGHRSRVRALNQSHSDCIFKAYIPDLLRSWNLIRPTSENGPTYHWLFVVFDLGMIETDGWTEAVNPEGFYVPITCTTWDLLQITFCLVPGSKLPDSTHVVWRCLKESCPMRPCLLYAQDTVWVVLWNATSQVERHLSAHIHVPAASAHVIPCSVWTAFVARWCKGGGERLNPGAVSTHPKEHARERRGKKSWEGTDRA